MHRFSGGAGVGTKILKSLAGLSLALAAAAPTGALADIALSPASDISNVGTAYTVCARVITITGGVTNPVIGTSVTFNVTSGPNATVNATGVTDPNGVTCFTYVGTGGAGRDIIDASFIDSQGLQESTFATNGWVVVCTNPVTVTVYSGHTVGSGGAPYSGLVGTFAASGVSFATDTGFNWHPFGLGSFGADITGILDVASTGNYNFTLNSDDGSVFFIDGNQVIYNGDGHPPRLVGGSAHLSAGKHSFEIQFFNAVGGSGVDLALPAGVTYGCPNHPPVAVCTDVLVSASSSNCQANASIDAGSYDPDAGDVLTITQVPAGPYPLGTNIVCLLVTDNNGASNFCCAVVTVVDTYACNNHPPVALCTNVVVSASSSNCQADASIDAGSYDPDAGDIITITQVPAGPYPLGTNSVCLIVTDNHGASNSCCAVVTVVDTYACNNHPPVALCTNVLVSASSSNCQADASIDAGSYDPDAGDVLTITQVPAGPYPLGTNIVCLIVTDNHGVSNSCCAVVTVVDTYGCNNHPPVALCRNVTVSANLANCQANASIDAGSYDPDAGDVLTITQVPAGPYPLGTNIVCLVVTDNRGASNSCCAVVTVVDTYGCNNHPPVALCRNVLVSANLANCQANASIDAGSYDPDAGDVLTITQVPAGPYPLGTNIVCLIVTDNRGASNSCCAVVTVVDTYGCNNHPPVALCRNVTVSANSANCQANTSIDAGSYDPDAGDAITITQVPAGPYPLGTNIVCLVVTDNHGASNSCCAVVTVVDNTAPSVTCPGNITATNTPGQCSALVSFACTAFDACGGVNGTVQPPSGSVFPVGTTTVTFTAWDGANNTNSCSFTVTVLDKEAPVVAWRATGKNGYYQLLASDNCDPNPSIYIRDTGSSFVCGPYHTGDIIRLKQAPGSTPSCVPGDAGVTVVRLNGDPALVAVDSAGNASDPTFSLVGASAKPATKSPKSPK